jgi:hypothetical protein
MSKDETCGSIRHSAGLLLFINYYLLPATCYLLTAPRGKSSDTLRVRTTSRFRLLASVTVKSGTAALPSDNTRWEVVKHPKGVVEDI